MKDSLISTFSWILRAFVACCVTIRCRALVGSECLVVGGIGFPAHFLIEMRLVGISLVALVGYWMHSFDGR